MTYTHARTCAHNPVIQPRQPTSVNPMSSCYIGRIWNFLVLPKWICVCLWWFSVSSLLAFKFARVCVCFSIHEGVFICVKYECAPKWGCLHISDCLCLSVYVCIYLWVTARNCYTYVFICVVHISVLLGQSIPQSACITCAYFCVRVNSCDRAGP